MSIITRALRLLVATLLAFIAAGCASTVYKDAATTYVVATRDLVNQISIVSKRSADAENARRRQLVISDKSCPIQKDRIFVRKPGDTSVRFSQFIQRFKNAEESGNCKTILDCEQGGGGATCSNACYSEAAVDCLTTIEGYYAIEIANIPASVTDSPAKKMASVLAKQLSDIEYGGAVPLASRVTIDGMKILAEYMDLLDKAATANTSDLEEQATSLTTRMGKVVDVYDKLSKEKVSSSDQSTRDNITKSIGAIGQLAKDVQLMRDNAKDAEKIKAAVNANSANVDVLINSVEVVATSDDMSAAAQENLNVLAARNAIATRFHQTDDESTRGELLDKSTALKYPNIDTSQDALKRVFDSLRKSHKTLVSLVQSPTNDQIGQLRNDEFQQFKTLATDAAGVFSQLSGFF